MKISTVLLLLLLIRASVYTPVFAQASPSIHIDKSEAVATIFPNDTFSASTVQ